MSNTKKLIQFLLNSLECSVCKKYMINEIIICQSGHNLCMDCNKKNPTCPVCNKPSTPIRNFTLEKIADMLKFPCKNTKTGCPAQESGKNLATHEQQCSYTLYQCVLSLIGCSWSGKNSDLKIHIEQDHAEFIQNWKFYKDLKKAYYVYIYNEEVFVICKQYNLNEVIFSGFYFGCQKKSENFLLRLTFEDLTEKGFELSATIPCQERYMTKDVREMSSLFIDYKTLKPFMNENSGVCVLPTIENKNKKNRVTKKL